MQCVAESTMAPCPRRITEVKSGNKHTVFLNTISFSTTLLVLPFWLLVSFIHPVSWPQASGNSTSGTFSTTYTSSRGSAAVSSGLTTGEVDPHIYSWYRRVVEDEEENTKSLERAERLVKKLCHGYGDVGALESCLSEMGLGWVLRLPDDECPGTTNLLLDDQCNLSHKRFLWICALNDIMESIRAGRYSDPSHWIRDLGIPFHITNFRLGRLVEATVVKMFPFVDALLAAADLDATAGIITDDGNGAQVLSGKLQPLLDVRNALSSASQVVEFFHWEFSEETKVIQRSDKARSLLSAKTHKLDEAIWNTMEEIRIRILTPTKDDDDTEWGIQTPQGSSDIAKVTRSLIANINYLWSNYMPVNEIVRKAAELGSYVPNPDMSSSLLLMEQHKTYPFTMLTLEMVSSLQVKLAKRSESFSDHSLRFLFLINNTHFICHQLSLFDMEFLLAVLNSKIEEYIQKYVQLSWAPVLSCLNNQTPRWFGTKTNSALPKFDSEFQKTYDEQKLWKVPDPQLRTQLRKAVIERVVPAFTKYLKVNKITRPGVTPQERETMLLELFEG